MIRSAFHIINDNLAFKILSRSTCIMGRKYPLTEPDYKWHQGVMPEIPQKNNIWQVVEHTLTDPNHAVLSVLLVNDVPGLGEIGEVRKVHRQRFWRYLHPLGLAELPTPERVEYFLQQKSRKPKVLKGDDFVFFKRLEQGFLYIPMNRDKPVEINKTHVRVALRRMGVNIREDALKIPPNIISDSTQPFNIEVDINGINTVDLPAQIFHWTKIDAINVTKPTQKTFKEVQVEDWLKAPEF